MEINDSISELLVYHYQHHKNFYVRSEILAVESLLANNILFSNSDGTVSVNFQSMALNEVLLSHAEKVLKKPIPSNISDAFAYVNEFKETLKTYDSKAPINAYSELMRGLRAYVLNKLNSGTSSFEFLLELLPSPLKRPNHLLRFEDAYFYYLESEPYSEDLIFKSCVCVFENNRQNTNYTFRFLSNLGEKNKDVALKTYNYGLQNDIVKYPGLAPNILIGLYNSGYDEAFSLAVELITIDVFEGLKAFAGFKLSTPNDVEKVSSIIDSIDGLPNVINSKTYLVCKLIQNDLCPMNIREKGFNQILDYLRSENHEVANAVFENVQYAIDDYEEEKFEMLNVYLANTKNFDVINDFFYNFKNPKYLFTILVNAYNVNGIKMSMDRFDNAIQHFWSTSPQETEELILDLFEDKRFGYLAVKIMLSGHGLPLPVQVEKLTDENFQRNAAECLCDYPHSIENLIPVVLPLRNSKFASVRKFLQDKLAFLIFKTYHESLYRIIENHLSATTDKKFLSALKKALDGYKEMSKFKSSIKDLDPNENERNLMDLYYRLEHENKAQMMKDTKKTGFMSMLRDVTVVRAKAFKSDDQEQIVPLQLITSSVLVNGDAYKNPIAFEQKLENI